MPSNSPKWKNQLPMRAMSRRIRSSLMLMGYLIRTQEERRKDPIFEQPMAFA